ncbi:MAG: hypothetical protein IPI32_09150 [Austwickia sp.]|nr:hypothetical protein [Austwickia sp.]MBK8436337.1 hypothetical protein [Austwickia sp.]MBK9102014.1 hypothetical protein [Austwickia sp.]
MTAALPGPADGAGAAGLDPVFRGDSIIATWGLLMFGHLVEGCFGVWALAWGGLEQRYDDPTPAVVAVRVITVLGWTGTALTWRMLRSSVAVRRALDRGAPSAPISPSPLALASLFVLSAVCASVLAVAGWQAVGVFPAVAVELMLIPLALRTERFIRDVQAGALSPEDPPALT